MRTLIEWGVRVGSRPPDVYQSLQAAEYRLRNPVNGDEVYLRRIVRREIVLGDWVEYLVEGGVNGEED